MLRNVSTTGLKRHAIKFKQASTPTQSRHDRVPAVCDRPATTSIANVTAADRRLLHHSGPVCSRPQHLRRLRLVDADACLTYRVALLCCAASDPSLCTVGHTTAASGRTGAFPAGLWNRRAGRPSGSPNASTPVGSECGGPTDLPPEDPRPHN